MLDSLEVLQPLLQTLVWALIIMLAVLILKREIRSIFDKLLTAQDVNLKVGPLSFEAKAMREIRKEIDAEFPGEMIRKIDIDNLIENKIKSLHGSMERKLAQSDLRKSKRNPTDGKIKIVRDDGSSYFGTLLDISKSGIGFLTNKMLTRGETVEILVGESPDSTSPVRLPEMVKVVRMSKTINGYLYGCAIV
jgi:hypothetical protein